MISTKSLAILLHTAMNIITRAVGGEGSRYSLNIWYQPTKEMCGGVEVMVIT